MLPLLIALLTVAALIVRARRSRSRLPLPPGPKPWPFIGNMLDMPTVRPWEKYHEWCETYDSDVIFLDLPMQPTIILGSADAALDLLDKRSNIYSSKSTSVMIDLMGWEFNLSFMPYTNRWRAHRRMFHQQFYQGIVSKYQPVQRQQAREFLSWALKDPANTRKHVRLLITSVIFYVTYGKKITSIDDEYVTLAKVAVEALSQAVIPGACWVEYMPILKYIPSWVPGTASMKLAEKYLPYVTKMKDQPYSEVKAAFNEGSATPCMTTSLLERNVKKYGGTDEEAIYDEIAKNVTGLAYAGMSGRTSSACLSFLLAMALFPEVQKRAQAELDRVVGPSRLPEYEDIAQIPYIRALIMETMRWMPVIPFGVPHAVIVDDEYKGYHIPKGSMVVPNAWAMLHNPEDYPSPEEFKPERFLDEDGNIDPSVRDPTVVAFGFGRRICLGRHFSDNTLSIYIASVLHVFDITPGVDASGSPIKLTAELAGGLVAMPRDVPCGLRPRSEAAAKLIWEATGEGDSVL
ncbi:CyP450 monooxygenase [Cristinia sonorae]|uniref:CyP450 monooxygenase n=1 Tax=Cristinia sonorae TaxID=1940300 RepID=A0A8K0UUL0_9AGAR|nr:CyP450 monooxygenase [Cristinia sonorae]